MVKRVLHILLVFCIFLANGCTKNVDSDCVSDNDNRTYRLYDPYVDEFGNKGIVADMYEGEDGWKYIMVLSADEAICAWGPLNLAIYSPYGGLVADFGLLINQLVQMRGIEDFPAFKWCNDKNPAGEHIHSSSWMLPSLNELYWIFSNDLIQIDKALASVGGTPLSHGDSDFYWTCQEDIDDWFHFADPSFEIGYDMYNRAVPVSTGALHPRKNWWKKNLEYRVRAIKYIYFKTGKDE